MKIQLIIAFTALVAPFSNAAIVAVPNGLKSFVDGGGGTSYSILIGQQDGFDPFGADKIIISVSAEGQGSNRSLTGASYNGQTLTLAQANANGGETSGIYFADLDGTLTAGTLIVSFTGNTNGLAGSLIALTGTETGVGNTAQADGVSTTIDASADSFVLAHLGTNGSNAPSAGDGLTTLLSTGDGALSASAGSGYQFVGAANSSLPISFTGANAANRTLVAAEFTAAAVVPEPSTTALLGLGGLALILRRRK